MQHLRKWVSHATNKESDKKNWDRDSLRHLQEPQDAVSLVTARHASKVIERPNVLPALFAFAFNNVAKFNPGNGKKKKSRNS